MCISFAKQCGEGPVKPFRLEPAPARSESKIHFPFARLPAALIPLGLSPLLLVARAQASLALTCLPAAFTPTCELFSTEC